MRTLIVLGLAACGGAKGGTVVGNTSPAVETLPGTRPFPAFARADFVVAAQTGELVAYTLQGNDVTEIGRVKLVDDVGESSPFGEPLWFLDRDHFVVRGKIETELWIVTAAGAAPLTAPPDEKFAAIDKPVNVDMELDRGYGGFPVRIGTDLYWEHCAWGYPADGFQCEAEGWIRMWPLDPSQRMVTRDDYPKTAGPDVSAPSSGWVDAKPAFVVSNDEDSHATCQPAQGDPIVLPSPVNERGYNGGATHWFAGGIALVEFGDYGLSDFIPAAFSVYGSCGGDPLFSGEHYELFADGLWVADEAVPGPRTIAGDLPTVSRLRRQLDLLVELPPNRGVAIRPAR